MSAKMSGWVPQSTRVSEVFACATKNPIADAQRAADATLHGMSLGLTLEKHCFRLDLACGASIAAEEEP